MTDALRRLKQLREYRRLSQDTVAGWMGISKQAYGKKERGESDGFSLKDFETVLSETEIDARWLFGQRAGPIEDADLRLNKNDADEAHGVAEMLREYRTIKDSTDSQDSVIKRIRQDDELRSLIELLIENRSDIGRVRGSIERIAEERRSRDSIESDEKREPENLERV